MKPDFFQSRFLGAEAARNDKGRERVETGGTRMIPKKADAFVSLSN